MQDCVAHSPPRVQKMLKPKYPLKIYREGQIIGLKKYAHGYTGCIEMVDHFEFFHFARGNYKAIQKTTKADFTNRDHFIDVFRKFVHTGFFIQPPVAVSHISSEVLEQILPG